MQHDGILSRYFVAQKGDLVFCKLLQCSRSTVTVLWYHVTTKVVYRVSRASPGAVIRSTRRQSQRPRYHGYLLGSIKPYPQMVLQVSPNGGPSLRPRVVVPPGYTVDLARRWDPHKGAIQVKELMLSACILSPWKASLAMSNIEQTLSSQSQLIHSLWLTSSIAIRPLY